MEMPYEATYRVDAMHAIERLSEADKNCLLLALLMKRQADGLNGRPWHASTHLEWEEQVARSTAILGLDP